MNRLTTYIGGYAHGLPGKTEAQALKSRYAIRGDFECTAIIERLAAYEDNTQTPKEQADMINNYKQMSQALEKQKEQNMQMRKMLDRLKKALGVACSMQLDRILPSDIKAVVNIVLHEAEKYDSTLVEGLCCDCFYDKKGFCGDYSENDNCPYKKKDGSCWKPHK